MGRLALSVLLVALPAGAGEVTGRVHVAVGDSSASRPKADASGVVVFITDFSQPPPSSQVIIEQKRTDGLRMFAPSVAAITQGQTIVFRNADTGYHNVFSSSPPARKAFGGAVLDIGQARAGDERKFVFSQAGIVNLYCNIHESMSALLVVVPNRAHAVTGADGSFVLKDVPPGKHIVRAYSRTARDGASAEVIVPASGSSAVQLNLLEAPSEPPHRDKFDRDYKEHSADYEGR